ncbi:hypothetical protein [Serinibacter salmoneus]|uniref:Uncharacterized protein n=1 Tax=Serinibacter salmoneus TaxID=556530 RepID=A0A2A9CY62_9MICO|nr:hypothetical protein [Serinibacter salmoneus]PFG18612.1 hypothetical protein ATL40_0153 [Serinibacter salmoneus]
MTHTPDNAPSTSRRTVLKGAAWSVPVVAASAAIPAAATTSGTATAFTATLAVANDTSDPSTYGTGTLTITPVAGTFAVDQVFTLVASWDPASANQGQKPWQVREGREYPDVTGASIAWDSPITTLTTTGTTGITVHFATDEEADTTTALLYAVSGFTVTAVDGDFDPDSKYAPRFA